jgi:hypothetical protein
MDQHSPNLVASAVMEVLALVALQPALVQCSMILKMVLDLSQARPAINLRIDKK